MALGVMCMQLLIVMTAQARVAFRVLVCVKTTGCCKDNPHTQNKTNKS